MQDKNKKEVLSYSKMTAVIYLKKIFALNTHPKKYFTTVMTTQYFFKNNGRKDAR